MSECPRQCKKILELVVLEQICTPVWNVLSLFVNSVVELLTFTFFFFFFEVEELFLHPLN